MSHSDVDSPTWDEADGDDFSDADPVDPHTSWSDDDSKESSSHPSSALTSASSSLSLSLPSSSPCSADGGAEVRARMERDLEEVRLLRSFEASDFREEGSFASIRLGFDLSLLYLTAPQLLDSYPTQQQHTAMHRLSCGLGDDAHHAWVCQLCAAVKRSHRWSVPLCGSPLLSL